MICNWFLHSMGFNQSDDSNVSLEIKTREMKYLIEEIKNPNLSRQDIMMLLIGVGTDMQKLACFNVAYAIDIFQYPKLRSMLSALAMIEIYQVYIKVPIFMDALNAKKIPSLQDIILRAIRTTDALCIQKIQEIMKDSIELREYANQKPTEHSKDPNWFVQPAPKLDGGWATRKPSYLTQKKNQ